jgi:ankyrin repeat protein
MEIHLKLKTTSRSAKTPASYFLILTVILLNSCTFNSKNEMKTPSINPEALEQQVSFGSQSHFLNHRQAFSPDDQYLAFDGRREDSKMGENDLIGLIHISSGEVVELYRVPNQQAYGPGAGAVSFNPQGEEVVFIRGLLSASPTQPYHFTRRSAMGIDLEDLNHLGFFTWMPATSPLLLLSAH